MLSWWSTVEEAAAGRGEGDALPAGYGFSCSDPACGATVPSLGSGDAGAPILLWGEGKGPSSGGSSGLCHTQVTQLPPAFAWALLTGIRMAWDVNVEKEARNAVRLSGVAEAAREG